LEVNEEEEEEEEEEEADCVGSASRLSKSHEGLQKSTLCFLQTKKIQHDAMQLKPGVAILGWGLS